MKFVQATLGKVSRPGLGRAILGTASANIGMTALTAVAGVVLARSLGPSGRGDYAAVLSWFGATLVLAEVGQSAAVTYFVSRDRSRAPDYVATSRSLMIAVGVVVVGVELCLVPRMAHHNAALEVSYRIVFVACWGVLAAAAYVASLQATNLRAWNGMRLFQPLAYFLGIIALSATHRMSLVNATIILIAPSLAQGVVAYVLAMRNGLAGGRTTRELLSPVAVYGSSQLFSSAPELVNTRLDQMVLSQTIRSSQLGHYAVAVTLSSLMTPAVAAIGNVMFPRLAMSSATPERQAELARVSLRWAAVVSATLAIGLAITAAWVVQILFGSAYRPAVVLVWILAPGGAFLACSQVCGDVLRGLGRPMAVALAQFAGAALTLVLLAVLIPLYGARGAAIASTSAYLVTLLAMLRAVRAELRKVRVGVPSEPT